MLLEVRIVLFFRSIYKHTYLISTMWANLERITPVQGLRLPWCKAAHPKHCLSLHQDKSSHKIAPEHISTLLWLLPVLSHQQNLIEHWSRLGGLEMSWHSRTGFSHFCLTCILLGLMAVYFLMFRSKADCRYNFPLFSAACFLYIALFFLLFFFFAFQQLDFFSP